jgi:hypothetical protein
MQQVDYFNDGYHFVASIDRGRRGFFELNLRAAQPKWKFVNPGSLRGASLDEDIYYAQHDFDRCQPSSLPQLPELPEVPEFEAMEWKDNFLPLNPMPTERFPELARILTSDGAGKNFWFVLDEDLYETFNGDGEYLYFHGAVFDQEGEAIAFSAAVQKAADEREEHQGYPDALVKRFCVSMKEDLLLPDAWYPNKPEDYSIERVLERIEEVLESNGRIAWGQKRDQ